MGVSWDEAMRMPWGVCRMMFESRAEAMDAANGVEHSRVATADDWNNWL